MKTGSEQSNGDLANAAFERVVDKVIKRARDTGTPVVVWKDGRIVALTPEEARLEVIKKQQKMR